MIRILYVILCLFVVCYFFISVYSFSYYDLLLSPDNTIFVLNISYIVVSGLYLFVVRRDNPLCPEFLLSITFYLGSYLVAYGADLNFMNIYIFNKKLSLLSTALVSIGWSSFICGALLSNRKNIRPKLYRFDNYTYNNVKRNRNVFLILSVIFIALHLYLDGLYLLYKYSGTDGASSSIQFYVIILLIITTYYEFARLRFLEISSLSLFLKYINKLYMFLFSFVCILTFFIFGDRSGALQIIIPFLVLYSLFIRRISVKVLSISLFVGLLFSILVRDNRQGSMDNVSNKIEISSFATDFMSVNAATPILIQYTNVNGYTFGTNMVDQLMAVIPFAQGLFLSNIAIAEKSSEINSIELLGPNYYSGQATNVVADLYYSFGVLGVILGLFLMGYIYAYLFNLVSSGMLRNRYYVLVLLVFFGNIFYFVRVEYTFILRMLSFSLIIVWMVNRFVSYKK